jgi:hypothetical protein
MSISHSRVMACPGKKRGAPAEAGRERNLCTLHLHQRIHQQLVTGAIEIATAVQSCPR